MGKERPRCFDLGLSNAGHLTDDPRIWDVTLQPEERGSFPWPRLLDAPVIRSEERRVGKDYDDV